MEEIWDLLDEEKLENQPDTITGAVNPALTDITANHRCRLRIPIDLQFLQQTSYQPF